MTTPLKGEKYWPLCRDVGAFFIGGFILLDQTVVAQTAQTILVVVGFACLGITGSGIAQRWLKTKYEDVSGHPKGDPPKKEE